LKISSTKLVLNIDYILIYNYRSENAKTKNVHDGKIKEENKYKGDYRNDRLQTKNAQAEPVSRHMYTLFIQSQICKFN